MKIIYIITKGNWGGAQKYVYELAVAARERDWDVAVAMGEGQELGQKLVTSGVRIIPLPHLGRDIRIWADILTFFDLLKLFKRERPDIIHLNSSKIGGLGALAGRIAGGPKIIFTGHGWAFNEKRFFISKILIGFSHWVTVLLCHTVITVSKRNAAQITRFPGVKNKIITVYNGVTPITFLPKHEAREKLDRENLETIWLGAIAELHSNKGLDILLAAFKKVLTRIGGLNLVIVGEGEQRDYLAHLIAKNKLTGNVRLVGRVPAAVEYLYAFDLFLLPSRTEAFPYVLLEAGLAGLPVIATNVGGIPEIIENNVSGILVPPENPEALAQAITNLLTSKDLARQLGQVLKQKVSTQFTKDQMLAQTFSLYEK